MINQLMCVLLLLQDSIQVYLKAGRGPITVRTCEPGSCDAVRSAPAERSGSFVTLEESRIKTRPLAAGSVF